MTGELTTAQVAEQIGCDKTTVSRKANKLKVGRMIGNVKVFTSAEWKKLKAAINDTPGNPDFGIKFKGPQPSTRPDAKTPGRPKKS